MRQRSISVRASLSGSKVLSPDVSILGRRYDAASATGPTGAVMDGFALALTPAKAEGQLGKPIWVTLEIRNVSGRLQHAIAGPRYNAYDFAIVNSATGEMVKRNPKTTFAADPISVSLTGHPVPASTSIFLDFDLNDLYSFKTAGIYTIRVTAAHAQVDDHGDVLPPSNGIILDLRGQ